MRTWVIVLVSAALAIAACSSSDATDTGAPAGAETSTTSTEPPSTAPPSTAASSTSGPLTSPTTGETSVSETADTCQPAAASEPGRQAAIQFELDAAGSVYPVRLYVPGDSPLAAQAGGRYPLVLDWHGLGSDGFQQALLTNYETVAEAEGFLVAHPTGGGSGDDTGGGLRTGWELAQFDIPGRDDLAMAEALIDLLVADYCADPNRVYSTGMSNGGFFTSRLVCDLADRIAAAVAVAGVTHHDTCAPSRPVPFMAFHGTADTIVPFDGGRSQLEGSGAPPELVEFFDQVMPDELAQFAADFACDPEPDTTAVSDEVTVSEYRGCADDVPVRFVEIEGGGHTWPGAFLGVFMTEALGATTTDVNATVDGWRFMSRFSLDGGDE